MVDDRRAFAAQFQRDRRQVRRRRLGNLAAHGGGAGKDQMIERQFGEGVAQVRPAGDDGQQVLVEIVRHEVAQKLGRVHRHLAGLDHHPVARGQRVHGRQKRDGIRIVPRGDIADHAQGLWHDLACGGQRMQGGAHPARAHPAAQVPAGVFGPRDDEHEIGQCGFAHRTVAEILVDGLADVVLMFFRQGQQLFDIAAPFLIGRVRVGVRRRLLAGKKRLEIVDGRIRDDGCRMRIHCVSFLSERPTGRGIWASLENRLAGWAVGRARVGAANRTVTGLMPGASHRLAEAPEREWDQ